VIYSDNSSYRWKDFNEKCQKYFSNYRLKNVFGSLKKIYNPEVQQWIDKSKHELNRFANYVIILSKVEKSLTDVFTYQALHESLNRCSVGIVFSLFNIFSLITKTRASFFDNSIKNYFNDKIKLSPQELHLLSFDWHEKVHAMDTFNYSNDENFQFYLVNGKLGFQIVRKIESIIIKTEDNEFNALINSVEFYAIHFLYLLSTIDLLSRILQNQVGFTISERPREPVSKYMHIENINDLLAIYNDCLLID
jgi:hypothetical protein